MIILLVSFIPSLLTKLQVMQPVKIYNPPENVPFLFEHLGVGDNVG